jgi:hypothetical protein
VYAFPFSSYLEIKPAGARRAAFESLTWGNAGQGDGYVVILGL